MHDLLFENRRDLSEASLLRYAEEVGADANELATMLAQGVVQQRVREDVESGIRSGVNGTPTFFVNVERYDSSWAFEPLQEFLLEVLDQL